MAPVCKDMRSMPYSQVSEKVMTGIVDNRNEEYHGTIISSNNDFLADIDPDIQLAQSAIQNQCKQYNIDEFNNSFSNLQNFLSMIHVNIRSSQKNLMDFICNLENLNVQFHFIVLSETWGTHDKAKLNITQGYNHLYDTREQRNGGGISIYVNANIAYKKRTDLKLDKTYFESYFIEVDKTVFQSKHNVIIGGLYKPPNVSIDIFNEKLEILLNKIGKEKKYAYIIGDYNINTLNVPSCKSTKIHDFVNLMSSYSYNKLICLPTRVIKDSSTLLDNIYSNVPNVYDSGTSGILHSMRCSDHLPIFTFRSISKTVAFEAYRKKRNCSKKNISRFRKILKANTWEDVYSQQDAQSAFTNFIDFIVRSFNESCPMETIKIKYNNRHEWISRELKDQIKEREKLYINSVKHPTEANVKIYKKFRNEVLSNQRRAAKKYYHEQFEIRGPTTKSGWALINFLTGQGDKNSQKKNHEFMINNKMISDNVTIADSFNEYFVNVGKSLAQKITSTDDPLSYIDYNNLCIPELVVSENCVKTVISQLNNSAPGHDGLPPSIMKQLTNEYVIPLTHLINLSIVQGDFPNELKLCNSSTKSIEYGVPQGSILGPLFFILFMNDFSRASQLLFSILFADDTSVFLIGKEYTQLIKSLNEELKKVSRWLNANGLTINLKKTHYMVFHRARIKAKDLNVEMQGNNIDCVTTTKYLGVIIDNKLKWTSHILYIKNKISKTIGLFYKMRQYLERKALINLYYSLVFPYLIYCNEVWGNASAVHLEPIIKIQKRAIRTITFSSYLSPSEPIFQSLNILNFRKLVIQRVCLLMFKISKCDVPKPLHSLFRTNNSYHNYQTRRSESIHVPIGRTEAIYKTFSYFGAHIWNHISNNISTNVSYSSFKHLVKFYIQNNSHVIYRLNI